MNKPKKSKRRKAREWSLVFIEPKGCNKGLFAIHEKLSDGMYRNIQKIGDIKGVVSQVDVREVLRRVRK